MIKKIFLTVFFSHLALSQNLYANDQKLELPELPNIEEIASCIIVTEQGNFDTGVFVTCGGTVVHRDLYSFKLGPQVLSYYTNALIEAGISEITVLEEGKTYLFMRKAGL